MQQAKLYSFQVKGVLDGVECSPFFCQSSANVRIHSQLGATVDHLVLSGPTEDFFFLLEAKEFDDEGSRFPCAGITWPGAEGAVSSLYLGGIVENLGAGHCHQQVRNK